MAEETTTEETTVEEPTGTDSLLTTPLPMDGEGTETEEVTTPEEETEEVAEEEAKTEEETEEVETEEVAGKPKKKNGFKRRLDREKAARQRAEDKLAVYEQQNSPKSTAPKNDAPNPDDFEHGINDINFIRAEARHEAKSAYLEEKQADQQSQRSRSIQAEKAKAQNNFDTKFEKALDKYPDLEERIEDSGIFFKNENVKHAIKDSDEPGELMNYFADNPEEAAKLEQMTDIKAVAMIGRLDNKLSTPKQKKTQVTKAPKPVSTLTGSKTKSPREYDGKTSLDEFLGSTSIEDLD